MSKDANDKEAPKKKGLLKRLFGGTDEPQTPHPSVETAGEPEAAPAEQSAGDEAPISRAELERIAEAETLEMKSPITAATTTPAELGTPDNATFQDDSAQAPADDAATPLDVLPPPAEKKGLFSRLKERLGKTKKQVVKKIRRAVALHATVSEDLLEEIEDILIQSDAGMETTVKIIDQLRARVEDEHIKDPQKIIPVLKEIIGGLLAEGEHGFRLGPARPFVILVVGVNGTGKTTTIGKLALRFRREGLSVMMVAADTFRAAAIDQLEIWARRTNAELIRQHEGADAASVCFDGLQAAVRRGIDVVLIDTAGRLHTKVNLMKELGKVDKVIKKVIPEAPHETLLVVDATTGQNALNQALTFSETTPLSGLVMTKLDGTAKGGILLALRDRVTAPVYFIGVGEQVDDLRDFDPGEFVEALFADDDADDENDADSNK